MIGKDEFSDYLIRVVFVLKANKFGISTPKDYRPIRLPSLLLKTLDKFIDLHIREILDLEKQEIC